MARIFRGLSANNIKAAFGKAEKEVTDLHSRDY